MQYMYLRLLDVLDVLDEVLSDVDGGAVQRLGDGARAAAHAAAGLWVLIEGKKGKGVLRRGCRKEEWGWGMAHVQHSAGGLWVDKRSKGQKRGC
jgi:hypothetical protein